MASEKNNPPKGVIVAVLVIIALVAFYFLLLAIFPDLFNNMNTGEQAPVKP